jgi:hypothetical protein
VSETAAKAETQVGYQIVNTMWRGFALIALGSLVILGFAFLWALVLEPMVFGPLLGLPPLEENPLWLATFVTVLSVVFMWFILSGGPSRFIRVYADPPQPRLPRREMLAKLQSFNDAEYPYEVVETESHDLLVHHRLADAEWRGKLFAGGLKDGYWLYGRLDEETGTAWLSEKRRGLRWDVGAGPGGLRAHVRWSIFYGIILEDLHMESIFDPLAGFERVADVRFGLDAVKQPIIGLLVANGWEVRYKILPWQVRKRVR